MNDFLYPASPIDVNYDKLQASATFRKQVGKVIISIALFLIVYLLLMLAAVALAIACFYAGITIIVGLMNFFGIIIGLGLIGVGISVLFFLIKFMFAVSKNANTSRVEISGSEQPVLFAFIRQLSTETQTPFPKKIVISPEVNASVYYNSSFWSMFLPVRKNLEIGLGLVNSVNISELKAVIAHEFGHFSQRSMKLGSFTYNVNHIIYNMLYDNKSYTAFLNTWGRIHGYLSFFALIAAKIASGIQWILRGMYRFINRNYLGLSREMEFHADSVAASVAGGNNLVSSLSRIEISDGCFKNALKNADYWLKQNKVSGNIYNNQLFILNSWAKEHQLPIKQGLPDISFQFIKSFSKSRINFKNQWASHPTLEERKAHLDDLAINVEPDERSAWLIFDKPEKLQEQMTAVIYQSVEMTNNKEILDAAFFEDWHMNEKKKYALPPDYQGFYSGRYLNIADWDIDQLVQNPPQFSFGEIFNRENSNLNSSITDNESDLQQIKAIKEKQIDLKSFDFDGEKHTIADCDALIARLEEDIKAQRARLDWLDRNAFLLFYSKCNGRGPEIAKTYKDYQLLGSYYQQFEEVAKAVFELIAPFYQGGITIERVKASVASLKAGAEKNLKNLLRRLLEDQLISQQNNPDLHARILRFLPTDYAYFIGDSFENGELNELREVCLAVVDEFNEYRFRHYKKMLTEQLEFYKENRGEPAFAE